MSKILITTSSFGLDSNPHLGALAGAGFELAVNPHGRKLGEDEVAGLMDASVVGLIAGVEPLTARVFDAAPGLKVISRCGVGMDNVDLAAAERRRIAVYNTPDAPADAVAELTVGLMLAVLRRLCANDRAVRADQWPKSTGGLLGARTVGIVGLGRIGRRVARLCRAFGARVIACDPVVERAPRVAELTGLETLLGEADLITLHLPHDAATHRLIDERAIGRMKPGAILVNTARGGLVDEDALAAALTSGRLAGAALDVFEHEPYQGPLAALDNIVLSPHAGSRAAESRRRMELQSAENLCEGLACAGLVGPTGEIAHGR